MKCVIILACVAVLARGELLPVHHQTAQDMCSSLPDLSFLKNSNATEEAKAKLLPHIIEVCRIYKSRFASGLDIGPPVKRNLLSGLSGLMGKDSKLGMLLKAADALSKAKGVFDEVKNLAPDVHDHLKGGIKDVNDGLQDLIDSIANEFSGKSVATTPSY